MLTCTRCGSSLTTENFHALSGNEPVCGNCYENIWKKFAAILEKQPDIKFFSGEISKDRFIKNIEKQFVVKRSPSSLQPEKNLMKIVRDHALDLVERKNRQESVPDETTLFPTRLELAEKYNNLLKILLTDPLTGLPFFLVNREKPGDDFLQVSIPDKLKWIFSPLKNNQDIKLWVNNQHTNKGMNFLQIISAICTGISNLIDMRELAKNPSFIISKRALFESGLKEGTQSKIRRLALQTIAPVFCTTNYRFSPEDLFYHSLSMIILMKIVAADRWRKAACYNPTFRELLYVMALILDRKNELDKAYFLMEKIFHYNSDDIRLSFHKARLRSYMGEYDLALDNIERTLEFEPENEFYKLNRYHIMEKLPVKDPYKSMGCPDIQKIYEFLEGEIPISESIIFEKHLKSCKLCNQWFEVMKVIGDHSNHQKNKENIVKSK